MTSTEMARVMGTLQAIVDMTIEHLEGRSYLSPETLLAAAKRARLHDGSETFKLFPVKEAC